MSSKRARLDGRERMALVAIAEIANQSRSGLAKLPAVALSTNLSLSLLEKYASAFRNGGLIKSYRGAMGGYALARPATEIAISEIIGAVNSNIRNAGHAGEVVPRVHAEVDTLIEKSEELLYGLLRNLSLDDLLNGRINSHPAFAEWMEELVS